MKKYMIGLLVTNKYGVLTRIASLFARRGYNIDTLTVGETVNPQVSRMTIMITGNDHDRDQMIKQLRKLHDVHFVKEMVAEKSVCRELVLLKVATDRSNRQEIIDAANVFRNKIIDYSTDAITMELTGETKKLDAFIELMKEYGILELGRTGVVSLKRGDECLDGTNSRSGVLNINLPKFSAEEKQKNKRRAVCNRPLFCARRAKKDGYCRGKRGITDSV